MQEEDLRVRGHITLTIDRVKFSSSKCCYPLCNERRQLHVIPHKVRLAVLKNERFFIPKVAKACLEHIIYDEWEFIDPQLCENHFTEKQIEEMIDMLRNEPSSKEKASSVLSAGLKACVKRNTALSLDQFNDLLEKLPSLNNSFRKPSQAAVALYIYLMKMRTGQPSEDIGRLFGISRVTVERHCTKVRVAMNADFVFNYVNCVPSREILLASNTDMGRGLFCPNEDDKAVLICDATYIFINKSSNHEFQKKTYNDQKKRNFLKIMMCVTCNGTIVYALGPYPAVKNDATILKSIFEEYDVFDYLQRNDVMILDRGFRDCVAFVESKGLEVKMPALLQVSRDKKQLSTEEANKSRLVTAIRFVVEARNGHLKSIFKVFDMTWNSLAVKHLQDDIRICCALINCYFRSIESNRGIADEIVIRMLNKLNTPNLLSNIVDELDLKKKIRVFEPFDDFQIFPTLTLLDLIYISLGRYQIEQAASYCQELMKRNDSRFAL